MLTRGMFKYFDSTEAERCGQRWSRRRLLVYDVSYVVSLAGSKPRCSLA